MPPDLPADSPQAVIQNTAPTTHFRDPTAKNDIHLEVSDMNNIVHELETDLPGTTHYNMGPKTVPKYAVECMCYAKHGIALAGFSMGWACAQMTAKEGLKCFGKDAEDALLIKWKQLDQLKVYSRVHWNDLTPEEQSWCALHLVQLIKLKQCGCLRGRTCADEKKTMMIYTSGCIFIYRVYGGTSHDMCNRRQGAPMHGNSRCARSIFTNMDDVVHVIVKGKQLQLTH